MHHEFQPFPVMELEFNPFEKFKKDWAALVVADKAGKKVNAMTIDWGSVGVLWDKNVATLYIRESRYTKHLLDEEDTFSINFLDMASRGNRNALKFLGSATGRTEDKIKAIGFHVDASGDTPYLDESNFVIICKKLASFPMETAKFYDDSIEDDYYRDGDVHVMYIAEITDVMAR